MSKVTKQERWLVKYCNAYFTKPKQKRKERFCKSRSKDLEVGL
jgi:hypothetical protein